MKINDWFYKNVKNIDFYHWDLFLSFWFWYKFIGFWWVHYGVLCWTQSLWTDKHRNYYFLLLNFEVELFFERTYVCMELRWVFQKIVEIWLGFHMRICYIIFLYFCNFEYLNSFIALECCWKVDLVVSYFVKLMWMDLRLNEDYFFHDHKWLKKVNGFDHCFLDFILWLFLGEKIHCISYLLLETVLELLRCFHGCGDAQKFDFFLFLMHFLLKFFLSNFFVGCKIFGFDYSYSLQHLLR